MTAPTRHPAHGEHAGEEVGLDAEAVIGRRAVEIDIRKDALAGLRIENDALDLLAHLKELEVASVGGDLLGESLEVSRARVVRLVDAVTEAHDELLALELALDEGLDLVHRADLVEHDHDFLVGAAVQRAFEGSDGGRHRAVHVAERGDGDATCESRGVEAVIGVQDQADVQTTSHRVGGLLAVEHPEEIGGDIKRLVGTDERLARTVTVEVGDERRRLGNQSQRLTLGRLDARRRRLARSRRWVVQRERRNQSAQRVHRHRVLGNLADHVVDRVRNFVLGLQRALKRIELRLRWQLGVPKQIHRLFVGRTARERVDVDADILEHTLAAVDERHLRFGSDGVGKPLVEEGLGGCSGDRCRGGRGGSGGSRAHGRSRG